jgi:hypothetical protein
LFDSIRRTLLFENVGSFKTENESSKENFGKKSANRVSLVIVIINKLINREINMRKSRENDYYAAGDFWLMLYAAVMLIVIFYVNR